MNVKILLVDDHPIVLRGLREVVAQQPNFALVGEATTGAMALKLARELIPDLVVMDIHLPDMNGIEASRQMLNDLPAIKIIIFSGDASRSSVNAALEAGVRGYLLKNIACEELMHATNMVMEGRLYLSYEASAGILEEYQRSLVQGSEPLKTGRSEER